MQAKMRKFLDEGESLEALFPIIAAAAGIAPQFPEIQDVTFKSQNMKADWTAFLYKEGYADPAGRVLKDFNYIDLEVGDLNRAKIGERLSAPARQLWIPTTALSVQHLLHLRKKLAQHAEPCSTYEDVMLTEKLRTSFKLGKYFHVENKRVLLNSGTTCTENGMFKTDTGWAVIEDCTLQGQVFVNDFVSSSTLEQPRKPALVPELGMGFGPSELSLYMEFLRGKTLHDWTHDDNRDAAMYAAAQTAMKNQLFSESKTMNLSQKTAALMTNLKTVGTDLLRLQRGRATLHSAKRVIFSVMPIKWGFLNRLTGKAKKIENHPLTDLGLALVLHGATNFAISDVAKREKYLKYTEEMLAAAGVNASLKMVPIEDMLDKIFEGVGSSEAVSKLKDMVKDTGESLPTKTSE
jgi:hypothetical protein